MPVTITINLGPEETLVDVLERAGLLGRDAVSYRMQPIGVHVPGPEVVPPYAHEVPTFGPVVMPVSAQAVADAAEVTADVPLPEPKRRGRPRGSTMAAKAAAEREGEPGAPTPSGEWLVRRYGGEADSEHLTPSSASIRLMELVGAAGDLQALNELMDANGDLMEAFPDAVAQSVTNTVEKTRATLTPAPQPEPAPAPAAPAWPMTEDRQPLTAIAATPKGARDAIVAIVTGPPPKYGHMVALRLLQKHGVSKLSELPEGDERYAKIATEGAEMLGLPVVGAGSLV